MFPANVKLSKNELLLVENAEVILTKNRIIKKVSELFGLLSSDYRNVIITSGGYLPSEVVAVPPKIYKGEQYLMLPYVMLDYPRYFSKNGFFAIRTLFWWGNFMSVNVLISGIYRDPYAQNLLSYLQKNEERRKDWFVSVHSDPWHHHFEDDNFIAATAGNLSDLIESDGFVKLAKKISLREWEDSYRFFINNYEILVAEALSGT